MKRAHMIVKGSVQGVSFRSFTHSVANNLSINGWVKNLPQGAVEIIAEGDDDKIEKFISEIKQGPSASQVDDVIIEWEDPKGDKEFKILI
ncbi:acylphosphatase [Candidatus Aenigmatarchaeota archaeon]